MDNTYPLKTWELLAKHGHLHCAKYNTTYAKMHGHPQNGQIMSNWNFFQVRKPLIKIDGGNPIRTSSTKVEVDNHTRESWMKLWDDAHTNPYQKLAKQYASKTIASMNQV